MDHVFYEGQAKILNVNTLDGQRGILENHSPFVDIIVACEMNFRDENDEVQKLAVSRGYLFVWQTLVTVYVSSTEFDFQIDIEEARKQQKIAEEMMKDNLDIIQMAHAKSKLDKNLNRIVIASKAEGKAIH